VNQLLGGSTTCVLKLGLPQLPCRNAEGRPVGSAPRFVVLFLCVAETVIGFALNGKIPAVPTSGFCYRWEEDDPPPNTRPFTFIVHLGLTHPKTRKHVRLLGPCFQTGH